MSMTYINICYANVLPPEGLKASVVKGSSASARLLTRIIDATEASSMSHISK